MIKLVNPHNNAWKVGSVNYFNQKFEGYWLKEGNTFVFVFRSV